MTALLEAVQLVRSFGARRAVDGVDALLVSPVAREAIFLGKASRCPP